MNMLLGIGTSITYTAHFQISKIGWTQSCSINQASLRETLESSFVTRCWVLEYPSVFAIVAGGVACMVDAVNKKGEFVVDLIGEVSVGQVDWFGVTVQYD